MTHDIRWIDDADITGFFDNIDWGWLRSFIRQRINDGGILRLIGTWLNAGIMEGEHLSYSDKGTPQGGVISPLLANIYLHDVLDVWFETEVKPRMSGPCFLVRFADDFVIGFAHEEDARRVMDALAKRFGKTDWNCTRRRAACSTSVGPRGPERAGGAGSQHLRLCRIHPLLGEVKAGILGHQTQDRAQKGR